VVPAAHVPFRFSLSAPFHIRRFGYPRHSARRRLLPQPIKRVDNRADALAKPGGRTNPNIADGMRSGPDRPRGRFNANRPFKQQPRVPQNNQTFRQQWPQHQDPRQRLPDIRALPRLGTRSDGERRSNCRREFLPTCRALFSHQQRAPRGQSAGDAAAADHAGRRRDELIRARFERR